MLVSDAWRKEGQWTPKLFEKLLLENPGLQKKSDNLCSKFVHLIFPDGVDPPTIRAIPLLYRAIRMSQICAVVPSDIPRCGDGLVAVANMCVGMTWLMGGVCVSLNDATQMSIGWDERGVAVRQPFGRRENFHGEVMPQFDDGLVGWKANEPSGAKPPNAVLLSSPDGIYLTICRPVTASPEDPEEILVYYGDDFERDYEIPRYSGKDWKKNADEDWEMALQAGLSLQVSRAVACERYRQEKQRDGK